MPTLQVVVTEEEKRKVERLVLKLNLYESKHLSVSGFLSRSLIEIVEKIEDDLPIIPILGLKEPIGYKEL